MEDVDSQTALAVLRALHLHAWNEKLSRRIKVMSDFQADIDSLEQDVTTNGSVQRELITSELDRLKDIIDCKKEQLLSKGRLEHQQKISLVEAQRQNLEPEVLRTRELRERVAKIQNLSSSSTFLSVCSQTMADLRGFLAETKPLYLPTDAVFRPFSVDAAHRALGNLDLSPYPTKASARCPVGVTTAAPQVATKGLTPTPNSLPRHGSAGDVPVTDNALSHAPSLPVRPEFNAPQYAVVHNDAPTHAFQRVSLQPGQLQQVPHHQQATHQQPHQQQHHHPSIVYGQGAVMRGGQHVQHVHAPVYPA